MNIVPGMTLGAYRIVEQTGRGGMATVYKAYQPGLARYVAIKVLPAFFAEEAGFRERFQQEAIAVASLRHPNILVVFDYGEENGIPYLVGDYIDGGTLADQVGRPLPLDYCTNILAPIASALDYAHSQGILHRDIKPSNVLLQRDGRPILADFGLAKIMGSMPRLTGTGITMGTPEYMAPEQAAGETMGAGADNYALAVVAYELLTGRVPFSAETPLAVLLAHLHKPLPLPRSINPAISPGVEAVLLKGLAKDPATRYSTATEFIHALSVADRQPGSISPAQPAPTATHVDVLGETPAPVLSSPPPASAGVVTPGPVGAARRPGARPILLGLVVAVLLCLVAGTAVFSRLQPWARPTVPPTAISTQQAPPTKNSAGWTSGSALPLEIGEQQALSLADGAVLVAGGYGSLVDTTAQAELYNPTRATWSKVVPMHTPRQQFAMTRLATGTVLVAGGISNEGRFLASAELYDPRTRTWQVTGAAAHARTGASATLLTDGDVLMAGGQDNAYQALASAELYHPSTRPWTLAPTMPTTHAMPMTTLLHDGRVFVVDGNEADLYSTKTGSWSVASPLPASRDGATATLLSSGKVLIVGGMDYPDHTLLATSVLYDPIADTWTPAGSMHTARSGHTATLLSDGRVLIVGGTEHRNGKDIPLASAEIYDPLKGTWSPGGNMRQARVEHTATLLPDGAVLVVAGYTDKDIFTGATELFTPAQSGVPGTVAH